jgi:hypothetical protein
MAAPGSGITNKTSLHNSNPVSVSSYRVLSRMLTLYRQVKKQEQYLTTYLPNLLAEIAPGNAQAFSPSLIKRTTKYWQLSLNLICDNLYRLTGKKLNAGEQKRIILLSVFAPLFDDLFDDRILDDEQIALLVAKPETYVPIHTTDDLVKKIYLQLLQLTPRKQQFIEHLQQVAFWQKASLKQLSNNITEEELYQVTYNKSYYAVLIYYAVLDHYPNQQILKMLYPVAGLMQLTNDAFDVWKDVHNGVYTLPNLYRNFEQLQQQFLADIALINYKLCQLPYAAKAKQTYAITIHSLNAMGWMALEQLKKVTAGISTFTELSAMSRKDLICDMDNIKQKIKWLTHIRRLTNYYDISSNKGHSHHAEQPHIAGIKV